MSFYHFLSGHFLWGTYHMAREHLQISHPPEPIHSAGSHLGHLGVVGVPRQRSFRAWITCTNPSGEIISRSIRMPMECPP
jgi:hypothetical protein